MCATILLTTPEKMRVEVNITVVESNMHNIKRLNIYTGKFERTEHLERPFPKNVEIVNNKMYFQVKEHEWDDTSYIYLQNL